MTNPVNGPESTDLEIALRRHTRLRVAGRLRQLTLTLCAFLIMFGILDCVAFLAGDFYFGGDAWSGKMEAGKFFLWGYHNGTKGYVQVSKAVFDYSRWHVYTLMVTWPLMIVAGFVAERLSGGSGVEA